MAKHEVACVACGRMFDAEQGGVYDPKSRRYTCPECAARQRDAAVAALAKKLRRRFIIKLVVAALFLCVGFSSIGKESAGTVILAFLIGIALVAWAVVPLLIAKKRGKNDGES